MKTSRERGAESGEQRGKSGRCAFLNLLFCCLLFAAYCLLLSVSSVSAQEQSIVEAKLTQFIRQIYNEDDDVRIKFNPINLPSNEKVKIRNISFLKIPDSNNDGICTVEFELKKGRTASTQVPFKVFIKKKIFVMRHSGKKGDLINRSDILVKETYHNGKSEEYPLTVDDVLGRVLKTDVTANTIITKQVLEEQIMVQRGELVNIVAENKRLLVQAKGRTTDKGRLGDSIRVKNIASGKEVIGRVVSSSTVAVQF